MMKRASRRGGFTAMSSAIEIVGVEVSVGDLRRAVVTARRLAEEWESRFSRFRPDSVLTRLNAANGTPIAADQPFREVLEVARTGVRRTGCTFDPSILPALEAAGYTRSIEGLAETEVPSGAPMRSAGLAAWERVVIDHANGSIQLPVGMRIDLGGIAKGAFVDRLAAELVAWPGGAVDAGGDMRVWGLPPAGDAWDVGIENPRQPDADLFSVRFMSGQGIGIATSGTHRRSWRSAGRAMHHLIDPRTGLPAANGVLAVTVVAASVTDAEIATKGLMLTASRERAIDLFGARCAVVVFDDGSYRMIDRTRDGNEWDGAEGSTGRAA